MSRTSVIYFFLFVVSCRESVKQPHGTSEYIEISGETMGTTYHMTIEDAPSNIKTVIDSILIGYNQEVSTYIEDSDISRYNRSIKEYCGYRKSPYFWKNLELGMVFVEETGGYFNPAIMPLMEFYGFGRSGTGEKHLDSTGIEQCVLDSLVALCNVENIKEALLHNDSCIQKKGIQQLDFSAFAKGYGVDIICQYLDEIGIENYFVEIGGEVRVRGKNPSTTSWKVGVTKPVAHGEPSDFSTIIALNNEALATSGNYRQFYKSGSATYVHTVNPFTGQASPTDVVSASILTKNCVRADAIATASMAMGYRCAIQFLDTLKGVDYMLMYSGANNENIQIAMSPNFQNKTKR